MHFWQSPGLILLLSALLLPALPARWRDVFALAAAVLALLLSWFFPLEGRLSLTLLQHEWVVQEARPFSRIFALAFSLALVGGVVFRWGHGRLGELTAALFYAGSALMICFTGDLLVLFLFWEAMAIASTLIVCFGDQPAARAAGLRYALMHLLGGVLLMQGIALIIYLTGSTGLPGFALDIHSLHAAASVPLDVGQILHGRDYMADVVIWLILAGVLVNLAAPPFSAWLADAYPETSPGGAVFLSAFTTKTAVYVLMTLFAGTPLLIGIGLFMVFYGIFYAMLENNLRRILAYSIVNQVGFMVVGIGIGTPLALYGAAAHAFCHIIYKGLLMMSAGAVVQQTGLSRCTQLGGLYHSMPLTTLFASIGAMSISAVPLTSGFVSKSMIGEAAGIAGLEWVYLLLLVASAGVFLHAGVKYPWFVFFQRDSGLRPEEAPRPMLLAMGGFALLCLLPGLFPQLLYQLLPSLPDYHPYSASHWVTQLQLLLFSGLAFFLLLPWLQRTATRTRDMDHLYRVWLLNLGRYIWFVLGSLRWGFLLFGYLGLRALGGKLRYYHQPAGRLARTVRIGQASTWVGILLAVYLLSYYAAGQ